MREVMVNNKLFWHKIVFIMIQSALTCDMGFNYTTRVFWVAIALQLCYFEMLDVCLRQQAEAEEK